MHNGAAVTTIEGLAAGETLYLARKGEGSPLTAAKLDDVTFANGQIRLNRDLSQTVSLLCDAAQKSEGYEYE